MERNKFAPRREFSVEWSQHSADEGMPNCWVVWEQFADHRECMTNERTQAEAEKWAETELEEEAADASE